MPYQDSSVSGGKVRLKHSMVAAETIAAAGLVHGELAINSADAVAYFRTAAGGVGQFRQCSVSHVCHLPRGPRPLARCFVPHGLLGDGRP